MNRSTSVGLIGEAGVAVRTVATTDGLWLYRTFSRRFVPWAAVEGIGTMRASWAGNQLITVTVDGLAVPLPGPTVGVFSRRYGRTVIADVQRRWEEGQPQALSNQASVA